MWRSNASRNSPWVRQSSIGGGLPARNPMPPCAARSMRRNFLTCSSSALGSCLSGSISCIPHFSSCPCSTRASVAEKEVDRLKRGHDENMGDYLPATLLVQPPVQGLRGSEIRPSAEARTAGGGSGFLSWKAS